MAFQAVAKPSPGADDHTNPPVKTFERSQSARCAEMAGSCEVASLHDSRVHDQRYISGNRLIVQQTNRASTRCCDSGAGCGVGGRTIRTVLSSLVCSRHLAASSWISNKEGRWFEGKNDKKTFGRAGGRPRAMCRMAAWHAGSACCSLAQSACE